MEEGDPAAAGDHRVIPQLRILLLRGGATARIGRTRWLRRRRRPKAGAPSTHKLWAAIEQLVEQTRDNRSNKDLLYQTRQGIRWFTTTGAGATR